MKISKSKKLNARVSYWREVLARAEEHPGSDYSFCVKEGLAKSAFYLWKKRLGRPKTMNTKPASSFAAVQVINPRAEVSARSLARPIDARWVAEFILHLHGGVR